MNLPYTTIWVLVQNKNGPLWFVCSLIHSCSLHADWLCLLFQEAFLRRPIAVKWSSFIPLNRKWFSFSTSASFYIFFFTAGRVIQVNFLFFGFYSAPYTSFSIIISRLLSTFIFSPKPSLSHYFLCYLSMFFLEFHLFSCTTELTLTPFLY